MKVPKPSQNDVSAKLWDEVKAGFATEGATETQRLDDLRSVTELDKAGPNREVRGWASWWPMSLYWTSFAYSINMGVRR